MKLLDPAAGETAFSESNRGAFVVSQRLYRQSHKTQRRYPYSIAMSCRSICRSLVRLVLSFEKEPWFCVGHSLEKASRPCNVSYKRTRIQKLLKLYDWGSAAQSEKYVTQKFVRYGRVAMRTEDSGKMFSVELFAGTSQSMVRRIYLPGLVGRQYIVPYLKHYRRWSLVNPLPRILRQRSFSCNQIRNKSDKN